MSQQIKIYVTGKKKHAVMFMKKMRAYEGVHMCSRWVETANLDTSKNKPVPHWQQENFDDIVSAHAVIVYGERGDHLRGTLVEAGYALAFRKPVYVIGQHVENADDSGVPGTVYHPDYDEWSYFSQLVRRVGDFDQAITEIRARVARDGMTS